MDIYIYIYIYIYIGKPVSSKEFLEVQVTIGCRFTLKLARDT